MRGGRVFGDVCLDFGMFVKDLRMFVGIWGMFVGIWGMFVGILGILGCQNGSEVAGESQKCQKIPKGLS